MPAFDWKNAPKENYRWLVYGVPGVGKTTLSKYLKGKTIRGAHLKLNRKTVIK